MTASAIETVAVTALQHPPTLLTSAEGACPTAPERLDETGVESQVLSDLLLRLAYTVPSFSGNWASKQTCLPTNLVQELCWQLKQDHLLEILGQDGPIDYRYAATQRGREQAARLMEFCGYIGPAPVSLQAYTTMLKRQGEGRRRVTMDDVRQALQVLVMPEEAVEVASLAAASGKSLFLFGPAGNGKTSLGRLLHSAFDGELWIPHCINIGGSIIRLYDPTVHQEVAVAGLSEAGHNSPPGKMDRRWICIRRPFLVAGGEMTIEELDLAYSPSLRFYEAPPHVKANGGTFMIDDFGRQRVDPHDLLNRWIIPLESQTDHLTLCTGQKIPIPFQLMLIVATNLSVSDVADPAFLRRMGYRLHLDYATPENYQKIFQRYAEEQGVHITNGLINSLLDRYKSEQRDLRASEPRDLIERARDICRLRCQPLELNQEILDWAWRGYFGNAPK